MVEFSGWRMPVSFAGILKEVSAVRSSAGLFDVSHMGRLDFRGPAVVEALQWLTSNDVLRLQDLQAQYSLLLNDSGGVVDDVIVYRFDSERFALIVNASNIEKDKSWMISNLPDGVVMDDITETTALFALQGPASADTLRAMGLGGNAIPGRFRLAFLEWHGVTAAVSGTGYTGEIGFEIACCRDDAVQLWQSIMDAGSEFGIAACGLGARDVLRIEAGLPLYGNEIDEYTSPVEAGLMRFVKMEKPDFIGKNSVAEALSNPKRRHLVGIALDGRAVPRSGDVVTVDGVDVGTVTSGTWSPTLEKGIGMAYVAEDVGLEQTIWVSSRGRTHSGTVVSLPFYQRRL
jgi:aminomethyltransferase